ncbi:Integral membrane protein YggT, involved in response to extracytoplasmic stress (osmotic shock) [hydrothermal vent metagenome]|uniref:Integral membrane protein YggT, involved in response to extracytoplasmic stress (Osmotic shock) n=1 Tax=hydrothermal vent metagenome TaxID=652676 RepID=A0A3B1DWR4_9ZZZZ
MINALFVAFATILISTISLYKWVIIIGALLSWVQLDQNNPIVQMIYRLTQPAYIMLRRFIPTIFGGVDLAPVVLIFLLQFLEIFFTNLFFR